MMDLVNATNDKISNIISFRRIILLVGSRYPEAFKNLDNFLNCLQDFDLSNDLQHCKIYITSTAQEKVRKEIVANLNIAKSSIRHSLGKRIEMRRVPEIIFKDDIVLDKGLSVLKLLDELK